jgi:hypothetical protein
LLASESADLDESPGSITYAWECKDLTQPEQPCFGIEQSSFAHDGIFDIPSTSLTIGKFLFSVTVSKPGRSSGIASVLIFTNGQGPEVSIEVPRIINPNQASSLIGTAQVASANDEELSWEWSVVEGDVTLDSYTDCYAQYTGSFGSCRYRPSLVINSGGLASGASYTFQLKAINAQGVGYSYITIDVNDKPSGGCCTVVQSGFAFSDLWRIKCTGWEDLNLPLHYEFYRSSEFDSQVNVPLTPGILFRNYLDFVLPPGKSTITVFIYDNLGAATSVVIPVEADLNSELASLRTLDMVNALFGFTNESAQNLAVAQYESDINLVVQFSSYIASELNLLATGSIHCN